METPWQTPSSLLWQPLRQDRVFSVRPSRSNAAPQRQGRGRGKSWERGHGAWLSRLRTQPGRAHPCGQGRAPRGSAGAIAQRWEGEARQNPIPQQHPHNRRCISGEATISLPHGVDFCAPVPLCSSRSSNCPGSNPWLPSPPRPRDQHPEGAQPGSTGTPGTFSTSSGFSVTKSCSAGLLHERFPVA